MAAESPDFRPIVLNILNRWSGLKIIVENQFGGRKTEEKAIYIVDYVHHTLTTYQSVEAETIEDFLIDYLDSECNTLLEDDSPMEVSRELVKLYQLFKNNGLLAVEEVLRSYPPVTDWLGVVVDRPAVQANSDSDSESESDMETEEDPEWTKVSYGRKK